VQIFEHAFPDEVQPPSPNVASSRHAPDEQSPSKSHEAPFGCVVIFAVLHAALHTATIARIIDAATSDLIDSEPTRDF
jgi:hypothetical protein